MATPWNKATALPANTPTVIAEAPPNRGLRCHFQVLNRNNARASARIHYGTDQNASPSQYIEYDVVLLPKIPLRNWPFVLKPGEKIYVLVDAANCNAVAWGELDPEDS